MVSNDILNNLDKWLHRLLFYLGMSNSNQNHLLSFEEIIPLIAIRWYAGYNAINVQIILNPHNSISDFRFAVSSIGNSDPYCFRVARIGQDFTEYDFIESKIKNILPGIAVITCQYCGSRIRLIDNKTCNLHHSISVDEIGFVYLYGNLDKGLFKIGASKNPERRAGQLAKMSPYVSVLLHKIPSMDMRKDESLLHTKYASKKQSGEWFELDKDDVSEILAIESI